MSSEWSGNHSSWDQRGGPQAGGLRSELPIGNQCLCEPVSFPAVPWRHGARPQSFFGRRAVLPFKPGTPPPAGPSIIRAGATAITRGPVPSTTGGGEGVGEGAAVFVPVDPIGVQANLNGWVFDRRAWAGVPLSPVAQRPAVMTHCGAIGLAAQRWPGDPPAPSTHIAGTRGNTPS